MMLGIRKHKEDPPPAPPPPAPKRRRDADLLSRLGEHYRSGELSERDVNAWVWVYAANHGKPFMFRTNDMNCFTGGPTQALSSLKNLARLGWVSFTIDVDTGYCTVLPTP
jgi:hypothetical protein